MMVMMMETSAVVLHSGNDSQHANPCLWGDPRARQLSYPLSRPADAMAAAASVMILLRLIVMMPVSLLMMLLPVSLLMILPVSLSLILPVSLLPMSLPAHWKPLEFGDDWTLETTERGKQQESSKHWNLYMLSISLLVFLCCSYYSFIRLRLCVACPSNAIRKSARP